MNKLQKAVDKNLEDAQQKAKTAAWAMQVGLGNPKLSHLVAKVCVWEYDVMIEITPDPATLRKVRYALGPGWRLTNIHHRSNGDEFRNYCKDGQAHPYLCLVRSADLAKDVCKIEQIGIKQVPVYRVTCS